MQGSMAHCENVPGENFGDDSVDNVWPTRGVSVVSAACPEFFVSSAAATRARVSGGERPV
jgi:hypothetical protein